VLQKQTHQIVDNNITLRLWAARLREAVYSVAYIYGAPMDSGQFWKDCRGGGGVDP